MESQTSKEHDAAPVLEESEPPQDKNLSTDYTDYTD